MPFGAPELIVALAAIAIVVNWYRGRHFFVRLARQVRRLFDPESKW